MDTIELSSKLIKFKSITPDNSGAIDYIQKVLKKKNKSRLMRPMKLEKK